MDLQGWTADRNYFSKTPQYEQSLCPEHFSLYAIYMHVQYICTIQYIVSNVSTQLCTVAHKTIFWDDFELFQLGASGWLTRLSGQLLV